ncbi:MAG TPA: adenylate/guanylate cyclase domain-containing protein, partial [Chloroflexia bacterium]|nr:adenylate/guanylate cyclase domain-containing protein [Chloroflexia bacterium]
MDGTRPADPQYADTLLSYLPMDRRQALVAGTVLPDRTQGAALFADLTGFTPLTEALATALGPHRGAEELTHHLEQMYTALITAVHDYHGSVIGFSGDALTCWFDGDPGTRATRAACAMQTALATLPGVVLPDSPSYRLTLKVAVATGPARRFLVGDPALQVLEVLAGR